MPTHAELQRVWTNLAQDRVGCHPADARHIREIDSEDSVQFAPQIERSGFVVLALVWRLFRPCRGLRLGCRGCLQVSQWGRDLAVDLGDEPLRVAETL